MVVVKRLEIEIRAGAEVEFFCRLMTESKQFDEVKKNIVF